MHVINMILGLILLIFFFSFSYMNLETVQLSYYKLELNNVPIWMVVVGAFIAGAIVAWFYEIIERFRLHRIIWKQNKKIKEIESKIGKKPFKDGQISVETNSTKA